MPRRAAAAVSRPALALYVLLAAVSITLAGLGTSGAVFTSETSNPGNSFGAAPDWTAPAVSASVVSRNTGPVAGHIKPGALYHIYANVSDSGNPPSGVSTVTADVGLLTGGQIAVPLIAGSHVVDGAVYTHRSAVMTADLTLGAGPLSYSITAGDGASNSRTENGFGVTVDTTAPTGSDVQATNGGATAGKAEAGDIVDFTFSEPMDPGSILGGWLGTTTDVVLRITNTAGNDTLTVYDSSDIVQSALGSVKLGGNYVAANRTFGATGTPSTMTQTGAGVRIVLGTANGTTPTAPTGTSMTWTPSGLALDRAGNAGSIAPATESGVADTEF